MQRLKITELCSENLSVGCCATTLRLQNPSHMLMGCHLALKSTETRRLKWAIYSSLKKVSWNERCKTTKNYPVFVRVFQETTWCMNVSNYITHIKKKNSHPCVMGYTVGCTTATNKENSSHVPVPVLDFRLTLSHPLCHPPSPFFALTFSLSLSGPVTQFKSSQTPPPAVCLE